MIKAKIYEVRNFFNLTKICFKITLQTDKKKREGVIIFDTKYKKVIVNLEKPLSNYSDNCTEYEQLAVLKEIFYRFCLKRYKNANLKISDAIEEYTFVDANNVRK